MIHVCLTHDIDRIDKSYQYITKPLRALVNGNVSLFFKLIWSALKIRNPYWGFDVMMRIEKEQGVKSTCFFLNESIKPQLKKPDSWKLAFGRYRINDKRIVSIIRELDANGWEVGVHGSFQSNSDYELLKHEKETLENIVGHEVIGIRQHYLNFAENTFEIHNKCGFKYDTTWGLTREIGFKDNKVMPFFPLNDSDYCEIPMTIMDTPFAKTSDKWNRFNQIVDAIDSNDGYIVINYHNNNFSDSDFLGYDKDYVWMIELLKSRNSQFMTMSEAYQRIIQIRHLNTNNQQ